MNIPAAKWHNAIQIRRSRRQFIAKTVPEEAVTYLLDFTAELNGYIDGARVVFITGTPDNLFKGAVGPYGKIKDAPAYAAFIGDMGNPNVQEKTGYLGEAFILEATSMGLATCWVGGTFNPKVTEKQIDLKPKEKILAVTPVGYPGSDYGFGEKLVSWIVKSRKRKDLANLCDGLERNKWPDWVRSALEDARLAPSAVNRQPWRFAVEKEAIRVSVDAPKNPLHISKGLDCGIAMLHLEVGALVKGVKGTWEYLCSPDVARFKMSKN